MSAVLTPTENVSVTSQTAEKRFVLNDVSWETYVQLLRNYENSRVPRFTYNNGVLEIMSPLPPHEDASETLSQLVYQIIDVRKLKARGLGSTTFKRKEWDKGAEPDGCFYIQSVDNIKGKDLNKIDITDFPPDLVIEVDYTSPSLDKFPIYATLGVSEIWHYQNEEVKFFRLEENHYSEISESLVLPKVIAADITRFIHENQTLDRPEWLENVQMWLHSL